MTAVEIIKALKARMLDGSLYKFSMDNCCFDPIKRNIEYDHNCPSGYYKLDLADAKDREICKKLLLECKTRRQDIFRNEKLDEKRISLTKALVCGGYDGNWKGWEVSCGREAECCMMAIAKTAVMLLVQVLTILLPVLDLSRRRRESWKLTLLSRIIQTHIHAPSTAMTFGS